MSSAPSRHRQLISSTLTVLGLSLLAKFSGALKEVVLAKDLGTSEVVDQFVFAFSMASMPAALLASILTMSLTPVMSTLAGPDQVHARQGFVSQLWGACVVLALLVGAASGLSFPWLSPLAGAAGPTAALVVGVVSALCCLAALATVMLICHGQQIASLLEGLPSLVLVIGLTAGLWSPWSTLFVGVTLGIGLQLLALLFVLWRRTGPVRLAMPARSPPWQQLRAGLGLTAAGYGLLIAALLIEMNIASHLPSGSVASLGYATRVTALVTGLLLTAVNRAAIVHFCDSRAMHASHWQAWGNVLLPFAVAALALSGLLAAFAPEIINLCFERGRFDADATATVSHLMRWHISQLAPSVAAAVLMAYLSAVGAFRQIFMACALCFCAEVGFAYVGAMAWGLDALAAAPMVGRVFMLAGLLLAIAARRLPPHLPEAASTNVKAAASDHACLT